jgi:hypothetical protein
LADIIGVRCAGERQVTFALIDGAIRIGQRVKVYEEGSTRSGVVVIAPEQMIEFHPLLPRARAEIDRTPVESPTGESVDLLKSLNLPEELLRL